MRDSLVVALALIGGVGGITTRAAADEPLPIYPVTEDNDAPSLAGAEEAARPRFDDHPFVIQLRTGAASATGLMGAVVEYDLHDRLAVDAGLGTNALGLSTALGLRVRPFVGATANRRQLHALVIETSLSRSAYAGNLDVLCYDGYDGCNRLQYVLWLQAEIGWEARFGQWVVQTSLGAASLLGDPQFRCRASSSGSADCAPRSASVRVLFSQTIGFGYAF